MRLFHKPLILLLVLTTILLALGTPVHGLNHSAATQNYLLLNGQHNVTGVQLVLVILVEFQDVHHTKSSDEMKNVVIDQLNAYYNEISYGKISISGQVFGWFTLNHPIGYYGHDSKNPGDDNNLQSLGQDAITLLPSSVDLGPFQYLVVVHAGQDQAQDKPTSQSDEIWSACFCAVYPAYQPPSPVRVGSRYFENYAFLSEINGVGTFAHEWGHLFGLPDLYDAKEQESYLGYWSLMDSGNNCCHYGQENTPSYLGAWCSALLGWLNPEIVDTNSIVSVSWLTPLESPNPKAILIPLSSSTYYFVEYRSQKGQDRYLPNSGVLISFVDESHDTGNGIIKLLNPNTNVIMGPQVYARNLNDAVYHIGQSFGDQVNHVYIFLAMVQGTVEAIYSKAPLSGVTQTTLRPLSIAQNATYSDIVDTGAVLADNNGSPLSSQTVVVEILEGDTGWRLVGQGITDYSGAVHLRLRLPYPVGDYRLRFRYDGELVQRTWYNSSLAEGLLKINPAIMNVNLQSDSTGDNLRFHVEVENLHGTPLANIRLDFYLDNVLKGTAKTDSNGMTELLMGYGITDIGSHTVTVQANATNYLPATSSNNIFLGPPAWLLLLIVLAILGAGVFAVRPKLSRMEGSHFLRRLSRRFGREYGREMKVCMYCGCRIPAHARFCTSIDCGKIQK